MKDDGIITLYLNRSENKTAYPTELTAPLLNTPIEKIVVHDAVKMEDGTILSSMNHCKDLIAVEISLFPSKIGCPQVISMLQAQRLQ